MGDNVINSSVGSQWGKGRADSIEKQVKEAYGIPPKSVDDIPADDLMDIDLMSDIK